MVGGEPNIIKMDDTVIRTGLNLFQNRASLWGEG